MTNPTVTLDGTTRGPWSVHGRLDGDKTFAVEPNNASTNAEFVIALCYGPEAKANAEAIAKLPDLARSCIAQAETIAELTAALSKCRTSVAGYALKGDFEEAAGVVASFHNEIRRIDEIARAALNRQAEGLRK